MPDHERLHERLEQLTADLTDIHMLLDELLHVLRYIQRNGLGVYGADARWLPAGSSAVSIGIAHDPSTQAPVDEDTRVEEIPEAVHAAERPASIAPSTQTQLFG